MGKHAAMSMTKSLTGLLAEILVAEGRLDDGALVSTIVPDDHVASITGCLARDPADELHLAAGWVAKCLDADPAARASLMKRRTLPSPVGAQGKPVGATTACRYLIKDMKSHTE